MVDNYNETKAPTQAPETTEYVIPTEAPTEESTGEEETETVPETVAETEPETLPPETNPVETTADNIAETKPVETSVVVTEAETEASSETALLDGGNESKKPSQSEAFANETQAETEPVIKPPVIIGGSSQTYVLGISDYAKAIGITMMILGFICLGTCVVILKKKEEE